VPIHRRDVRHCATVLHGRAQQCRLVQIEDPIFHLDAFADVGNPQVVGRGRQVRPRQRRIFGTEGYFVVDVRGRIDVCAGVDGEESESCGCAPVDIGRRLEMVGVCSHALAPALLKDAPGGGIHHVVGVRLVRVISRIDCCAKIMAMPLTARAARTCPGVASPSRSPQPADVARPSGRGCSHGSAARNAVA